MQFEIPYEFEKKVDYERKILPYEAKKEAITPIHKEKSPKKVKNEAKESKKAKKGTKKIHSKPHKATMASV